MLTFLKVVAIAIFVLFCVNSCSSGKVHTKIVKVPEVHVKVVEKKVKEPVPMPTSCLQAIDALQAGAKADDKQTNAAGQVLLGAQALGTAVASKDPMAIMTVTGHIRLYQDQLSTAATDTAIARAETTDRTKQCMIDLDKH